MPGPTASLPLRDWLRAGPFALALSAGYFGFFAHVGALTALEEEGLLPASVCGASAGALVAGFWAAGMDAGSLGKTLLSVRRRDFWDPAPGAGLLRGARFGALVERLLPVAQFEACRVPLAISVYNLRRRETEVLRDGSIATAIRASCGLPGLFHPVRVGAGLYADGGIVDRPGVAGAEGAPRVLLHYLPSRSPWRFFYRPAQIPRAREGRVTIAPPSLPRAGPFALQVGERAMAEAAQNMREALGRPVENAPLLSPT